MHNAKNDDCKLMLKKKAQIFGIVYICAQFLRMV